ncbi:hypothetical protein BKA93DRAFT_827851 [Sparassis latifolia]
MSLCFEVRPSSPPQSAPGSPVPTNLELSADVDSSASGQTSPSLVSSSRENSTSPTTAATLRTSSKWPAEDLTQFASLAAHRVRLKPAGEKELDRVSKLSLAERAMWTCAHMLKIEEHLEAIQPADAQWDLPRTLKDKIDHYTFALLLSPVLPFYLAKNTAPLGPIKLVMGILEKHPSWSFTKEVKGDKYKFDNCELKEVITLSLGPEGLSEAHSEQMGTVSKAPKKKTPDPVQLDVVELCKALAAKHAATHVIISLEMCARVAFLRKLLLEMIKNPQLEPTSGYWAFVDAQLSIVRERYAAEPAKMTKSVPFLFYCSDYHSFYSSVFTQILKDDQGKYGRTIIPGQDGAAAADISCTQNIANRAASGMFVDDEDDY